MVDFLVNNSGFLIFGSLIILGYVSGSIVEKRHYSSIKKREEEMVELLVINIRRICHDSDVQHSTLVTGSAVISIDYFKRFLAVLHNLLGGRIRSYESLIDRARREAILRMKEKAAAEQADIIVNFRLETSTIGQSANSKQQIGCVEALAYGTAVTFQTDLVKKQALCR